MTFQKGHPKYGGRKPNAIKMKVKPLMDEIKEKYPDYNPVLAMIEIGLNNNNPVDIRLCAHREVAQYMYAKRKAIDLKIDDKLNNSMVEFMDGLNKARK